MSDFDMIYPLLMMALMVLTPAALVMMFYRFKLLRNKVKSLESSLTAGELENLIANAVSDAVASETQDLRDQISRLQAHEEGHISLDELEHDPYLASDDVNLVRERS